MGEPDDDHRSGEPPTGTVPGDPAAWSELEWSVFFDEYARNRDALRSTAGEAALPRQLAAAALDRVVACHDVIWEMQRGRFGFFSGLIVRHAFECWVIGLYLCVSGSDALRHLREADANALRTLARERPEAGWAKALAYYGDRPSRRLNFEAIARDVGHELRRRDRPPLDPLRDYQAMYRAESRSSVHAGAASLIRHLEGDDHELWLTTAPVIGLEDGVAQTWLLPYAAHLGSFVFDAFGLPTNVMDNVMWRILRLFEATDESEVD